MSTSPTNLEQQASDESVVINPINKKKNPIIPPSFAAQKNEKIADIINDHEETHLRMGRP